MVSVIAFGSFFCLAHPYLAAQAVSIIEGSSTIVALIDLPECHLAGMCGAENFPAGRGEARMKIRGAGWGWAKVKIHGVGQKSA